MKKGLLILAAALMTMAPMGASAAVRVFVGGPVVYGGWYAPYWGPYWGPYGYRTYYPNSGEVKLDTKVKDAQVFINGAYAGLPTGRAGATHSAFEDVAVMRSLPNMTIFEPAAL